MTRLLFAETVKRLMNYLFQKTQWNSCGGRVLQSIVASFLHKTDEARSAVTILGDIR